VNETVKTFEFSIAWKSALGSHCDRRVTACRLDHPLPGVNEAFVDCLAALSPGAAPCSCACPAGTLVAPYDERQRKRIVRGQFNTYFANQRIEPVVGRYYPRALISGAIGCSQREMKPFRVLDVEERHITVDLNHPLACYELTLDARQRELHMPASLAAVGAADIPGLLLDNGPGMQAGDDTLRPPFFDAYPFIREDAENDAVFYQVPRLLPHIDLTASAEVASIYSRFLKPGIRVLDLMSSYMSHLPSDHSMTVTGLGMNEQELSRNEGLDDFLVHDLNESPLMPFADKSFDLVICTASVEYLVQPLEVFREVARLLRPGGWFVNTFSNRWFPPKAISLWAQLHPFERLSLVQEYYRRAGVFEAINTESVQGLPRPPGDKYSGRIPWSDPVFAVWARCTD